MASTDHGQLARHWKDIASSLFRLGATSYGGPAIMGVMQAELEEKRLWVSRDRFVEGLSLVNMLPGATATQLGIFLAYARGGWWGGLLGGLCFVLPAFFIMLALTVAHATLGVSPVMRGALYGLGPVVLGIFLVAVYRLGRSTASTIPQVLIGTAAAAASMWSPLGVAAILLLAAGAGLTLFHSRKLGMVVLGSVAAVLGAAPVAWWSRSVSSAGAAGISPPAGLYDIGLYFFKVGAFTIGGGLTMIAFIQDQVVDQFHWLTAREFIDGLALGQFTPGPVLMVAAYVGYKLGGVAGATVAAAAAFLPSFVLMLAVLPVLDRVRRLRWTRAALNGMGPAVIGVLAVSLFRLAPHALPDVFAVAILAGTVLALLAWHLGPLQLMLAGSVLGVLRSRLISVPGLRAARELGPWTRA
ncbi:MAG TPA: chromate efflux transporter [Methylomirabilota bacterium]|jgi:chromate transporter|nr:chromate efflux transporter [Methylomirabilota bacterium]